MSRIHTAPRLLEYVRSPAASQGYRGSPVPAPLRFGALSARGVPLRALLLSSLGIALAAVLSVTAPKSAFIVMVSISAFGTLFAWLMVFVTHYRFRRARAQTQAPPGRFRTLGFPATTLLGAALMAAVLLTSAFTDAFRMTLLFGLPFLIVLSVVYWIRHRRELRGTASSAGTA